MDTRPVRVKVPSTRPGRSVEIQTWTFSKHTSLATADAAVHASLTTLSFLSVMFPQKRIFRVTALAYEFAHGRL